MLSLSSLLNPTPPRPPPAPPLSVPQFLPSPTISSPATSYTDEVSSSSSSRLERTAVFSKFKMPKDSVSISKSKPRGTINFYPFEHVDEAALREIMRFHVHPFGQIQSSCAHIPYNSGKKDFYEKTGRESFEGTLQTGNERGLCGGTMRTLLLMAFLSIQIRIQSARERHRVHRHVGLQCWPRPHDSLLQVLQIRQGKQIN